MKYFCFLCGLFWAFGSWGKVLECSPDKVECKINSKQLLVKCDGLTIYDEKLSSFSEAQAYASECEVEVKRTKASKQKFRIDINVRPAHENWLNPQKPLCDQRLTVIEARVTELEGALQQLLDQQPN